MDDLISSIQQVPEQYQFLFQKLLDEGLLKKGEDGNLRISKDMFDMIILLARKGLLP